MTFLPIAERELRVSARNKAAHRLRILVALGAVAVAGALGLFSLASKGLFASQLGMMIFGSLKWMGFVFACAAGVFLTSDCLSEEKRDGTLGLLFLTDLHGYDVVMGKLCATSLRSFYSLLAIFPIMAFSFVLGGVANDDFRHTLASLCNTLFFSLALGMAVSVISRVSHKAMTATLAALIFLLFLPSQLDLLLGRNANRPALALLSPMFSITNTNDYHARDFWISVLVLHLAGWLLLLVASLLAPLTWHDKNLRSGLQQKLQVNFLGPLLARPPTRALLDQSPVAWIIMRDRWAPNLARGAIVIILGLLTFSLVSYSPGTAAPQVSSATYSSTKSSGSTSYYFKVASTAKITRSTAFQVASSCAGVLSMVLEFWVVIHIVRFYVEGRRNGFLELLLVTPTNLADVVRGHRLGLRNLFLPPLAAQLLLALTLGGIVILDKFMTPSPATPGAVNWLANNQFQALVQTIALVLSNTAWVIGLFALTWMAIWMGLTSQKTPIAIFKTFCYTKILPWFGVYFVFGLLFMLLVFSSNALQGSFSSSAAATALVFMLPQLMPLVMLIAVNMILIRLARRYVRKFSRELP